MVKNPHSVVMNMDLYKFKKDGPLKSEANIPTKNGLLIREISNDWSACSD